MPIKARIDMLSTGIRTPVGIKIFGSDLNEISKLGEQLESVLRDVPGTRSAYSERTIGGLYLDIIPNRATIARYGLNVEDVLMLVETAIGGMPIDRTVEGRERYSINVRYSREFRDDPEKLKRILVPVSMVEPESNLCSFTPFAPATAMLFRISIMTLVRCSILASRSSSHGSTPGSPK